MSTSESTVTPELSAKAKAAREALDAHAYEIVQWHFHESTGCPFWLEYASKLNFDPLKEVKSLRRPQEVSAVRRRMAPRRPGAPLGSQGVCRSSRSTSSRRAARRAFPRAASRSTTFAPTTNCSATRCPTKYFPTGSNWLMLGPSGPRRLRLAVEHLAQYRGGICFCIDLDPRWVIKLIKKGWMEHLEAYKQHCIDQAITILGAGHDIKCMFTTPKLLEALATALEKRGIEHSRGRHHRHLLRRHRVHAAVDALRHGRASLGAAST